MSGGTGAGEKLTGGGRAKRRRLAGRVNVLGLLVLAASLVIAQAGPGLSGLRAIVLSVVLLDFSHRLRD